MSTNTTKRARDLKNAREYCAEHEHTGRSYQSGDVRAMMLALSARVAELEAELESAADSFSYLGADAHADAARAALARGAK